MKYSAHITGRLEKSTIMLRLCLFMGFIAGCKGEIIYVRVLPNSNNQDKCHMPESLTVDLQVHETPMTFDLQKNNEVDVNVPVYVIETLTSGEHKTSGEHAIKRQNSEYIEHHSAYLDTFHGASFMVSCSDPGRHYTLKGTLYIEGKKYRVEPSAVSVPNLRRDVGFEDHQAYFLIAEKEVAPYDSGVPGSGTFTRENIIEYNDQSSRVKRATTTPSQVYIDVLVVIDYAIYNYWFIRSNNVTLTAEANIRKYFAHIINGANIRYQSIEAYNISLRLIGYVLAKTPDAAPWTEKHKTINESRYQAHANTVLDALKEWLLANTIPQNDHVMLFTGYDLYGDDNGFRFNYTTGLAFVGSMCKKDGKSSSVLEDHGGYQSTGTAAHEIGHSLGSLHDGDNNSCEATDRFIMSGASYNETSTNKYNPWKFSPCSEAAFGKYIQEISADPKLLACLQNKITVKEVPDISSETPGQLYGPDKQCQQVYGPSSYFCRDKQFGPPSAICRAMFCRNTNTVDKCVLLTAARGTSCGNQSWCLGGKCVFSVAAPTRSADCPFGDQSGAVLNGSSCKETVKTASGYCYKDDFRARCCETCKTIRTGIQDCMYGDKVLACQKQFCGLLFKSGKSYDEDCCGTCPQSTTLPSTTATAPTSTSPAPTSATTNTCVDQKKYNNMSCLTYLNQFGKYQCYNQGVHDACCGSCETMRSNKYPRCHWGDLKGPNCYPLSALKPGTVCATKLKEYCCEKCGIAEESVLTSTPSANQPYTPTASFGYSYMFKSYNGKFSVCFYIFFNSFATVVMKWLC